MQVKTAHYFRGYDTEERFCSYWHQINETLKLNPSTILEIGIGNSFVSSYLRNFGLQVATIDFDKSLKPALNGSVLNLPFIKSCFDVSLCCEVLEHLPFSAFSQALQELNRVSKRLILSLPDASYYIGFKLQSTIRSSSRILSLPKLVNRTHTFDGQHYWEIGKRGYSLSKIQDCIKTAGFNQEREFRIFGNPYNRIFILKTIT
jgi:ubiquinone/menaquinone biosynthesis C-methylase UbiE